MAELVVWYVRRKRPERLRVAVHPVPAGGPVKEFRLALVKDYNRTNKRIIRVDQR